MYFTSWRFLPAPGREAAFTAAYAGDGAWARLFARADGYLGTTLEPVAGAPGWWRTTDRWRAAADFCAFKRDHGDAYAALDAECEALTADERFERASLYAWQGDVTTLAVDAIVNAANEWLRPGGGVCGAIHGAAGPALAEACRAVAPCPAGEARLTPGFALPARHVIHAVGPVWNGGGAGEPALLASAYRAALELARGQGLRTVAFPAISTGIHGFPLERASAIAVATASDFLDASPGPVEEVILVAFDARTADAYRAQGLPLAA